MNLVNEEERKVEYIPLTLDELMHQPDPDWLIEGVIMRQSITLITGQRGSYKTFFALDMAMALAQSNVFRFPTAAGEDGHFIDRSTMEDHVGKTLYIWSESAGAAKFRVKAYLQKFNIDAPGAVMVYPDNVDFYDHADEVLDMVDEVDPDLIVIDTWSRNTYGLGDGIDKTKLDPVLSHLRDLMKGGSRGGRAVVIIHHPNQSGSNSLRGHSALGDDTDIIIKLETDTRTSSMAKVNVHQDRIKEMSEFRSYSLFLESVALIDDDGTPMKRKSGEDVTSLVISRRGGYTPKSGDEGDSKLDDVKRKLLAMVALGPQQIDQRP